MNGVKYHNLFYPSCILSFSFRVGIDEILRKKFLIKENKYFFFFDANLTQDEGNRYFNFEFKKIFRIFYNKKEFHHIYSYSEVILRVLTKQKKILYSFLILLVNDPVIGSLCLFRYKMKYSNSFSSNDYSSIVFSCK